MDARYSTSMWKSMGAGLRLSFRLSLCTEGKMRRSMKLSQVYGRVEATGDFVLLH